MNGMFTILFGEIVEFNQFLSSSRLSAQEIISRHNAIIHTLSEKYDGTIIENTDSSLKIIFKNPVHAAKYSIDLFEKFSHEPRIPYHIAINHGIIRMHQEEISGETAEIASGLLQICTEGAVLLSEVAADVLKEDKQIDIKKIGNSIIKKVESPLNVYCLNHKGLFIPTQMDLVDKSRNKNSIAVMAFHNTSSEKELDYICEGIAEEIIDSLTKAKDIFVTARSSSFMFKEKDISILEIGRRLNVAYVLDGSIRKRNQEYRISYQLVDSITGYNILSDNISLDFDSLYNSEKTISKQIISYFNPEEISEKENNTFYIHPDAYAYYLKGKYFLYAWDKDQTDEAITYFNKALEIVPGYALAYAGLSSIYAHKAINGFAEFQSNIKKAVEYAERSINADSSIPDGYVAKAIASFWMGQLYLPEFEKNITTALTISPCNAEIRMFNGMVFLFKGNLKRALSELKLAKQLDPFSKPINLRLGIVQYLNKDYQDAHNTVLSQLKEDTYKTNNLLRLAWCCLFLKHYNKALEYLSEASKEDSYYGLAYATYLVIYKNLKNEDKFFEYKSIVENQEKTDPSYAYNHAVLHHLLGNKELAIHFLEITLQNPLYIFMFFQYDAFWENLYDHPDFIKLIELKYNTKGYQLIRIDSETKEYIELKESDLLFAEAQDNYTLIVYRDQNKISEKILRATLSSIEKQINNENIIRCHRSYLVNSSSDFQYKKSEHKAFLEHAEIDHKIPISRTKEKELKELFR